MTPDASATLDGILQGQRLEALLACDANVVSYDPDEFFSVVFRCRGRNSNLIAKPLAIFVLWSAAWGIFFEVVPTARGQVSDADLISPLLTPVSFLLVFRLGRAAVRYWDARAAAGKLVETCRTLASTGIVGCNHDVSIQCDIARWACVMPVVVKSFVRPVPLQHCHMDAPALLAYKRHELGGLLTDDEASRVLDDNSYGPIAALTSLRAVAVRAAAAPPDGCGGLTAAARAQLYKHLNEQIDTLTGAWGAMERVNATPLPFAYVAHLRTFLLLYLHLWAVEALARHAWASVPVILLASFALLGIEAAAVDCERPFRGTTNHLALGKMCVVVARNVAQTLRHATNAPLLPAAGGGAGGGGGGGGDPTVKSPNRDDARVRAALNVRTGSGRVGTSTADFELLAVASGPLE